jgi:hypothetical protein
MCQFNTEGNLKPFANSRDKQLKNIMMRRGLIVPEDTINQIPMRISGPAGSFIKIVEEKPIEVDSTSIQEFEF